MKKAKKAKKAHKTGAKKPSVKNEMFAKLCAGFGLPEPVQEYKFHPTRKWRIDYFFECGGKKLALEVEGGVWTGGRHTRGAGFVGDMEKYNELTRAGIALLRVQPKDLLKTQTFELLKSALK